MSETQRNKTVLGPDCRISGELSLDNDAVIMGEFKGTLRVSGMLELTDSAAVEGTIIVGTLRLAGKAQADVVAEDSVELLPGAELTGQLFTSRLNVIEGAVFQGDVCVGPRAIQAATEALGQEAPEAYESHEEPQPMPSMTHAQEEYTEQEAEAEPTPVQTNSSVNSILQRRRPKVISRQMVTNGHGQS